MEFFNKKEEVLEFMLTNYGREKLAAGQLNPTYYAFFDDDVLYDVSGSGYTENQNAAEPRIQSDTPKIKIIPTREGTETRANRLINAISGALNSIGSHTSDPASNVEVFKAQPYGDKGRIDAYPMGRSSYNTQYAPAWQLKILSDPTITSAQRFLNDDDFIQHIPQIDITIDYQTFFKQGAITSDAISGYFEDSNIYLALKENFLMIELVEENTPSEKENFEMEVYHSGTEQYTQLSFAPETQNSFPVLTVDNVEYYMNILVDNDIPESVRGDLSLGVSLRDIYTMTNEDVCD